MRNIYIVLTRTNTLVSKIIRLSTKDKYNHVSISFDERLNEMYSFGRRKDNNPLNGGFVIENFNRGVLSHPNTECKVYKLNLNREVFEAINSEVQQFKTNPLKYDYNYLGCVSMRFNKSIEYQTKFFCSQFVAFILNKHNAIKLSKDFSLYYPSDFEKQTELILAYEGPAKQYRVCWAFKIKTKKHGQLGPCFNIYSLKQKRF